MNLQQLDGHLDDLGLLADGNVNAPSAKDSSSSIEDITKNCVADQLAGITSRLFAPDRGIPDLLKRSLASSNDNRNKKEVQGLREEARRPPPALHTAISPAPLDARCPRSSFSSWKS